MTIRGNIVFLDPAPNQYPYCVCDQGARACEHPCWMRPGLDDDFDPTQPDSCCCRNRHPETGEYCCEYRDCMEPRCMILTIRVGKQRNNWPKRGLCWFHGGKTIETGRVSQHMILFGEGRLGGLPR